MLSVVLLAVFLLSMIAIGIWGMRKTSTLGDFFLGGRTIGPWISAFAYGTAYFSAVIFIGFAGKLGWGFGARVLWIAAGNTVFGGLLAWFVLGKRTRRMTQNLDVMTMPEFLEERYQAKSMKMVGAAIIFVFLLPYSASVFTGLGYLFTENFSMSYDVALLIMVAITGIYLVLGGYFAVTLNDFIQGLIMIVGSIAMVAILAGKGGGFGATISSILEKYPQHIPPAKQPGTIMLFSLFFMTSFGTWGLPQMVQKFYAIKDEGMIRKAAIVTTVFALVISFSAYFAGAMAHAFYETPAEAASVAENAGGDGTLVLPMKEQGGPDFDRIIPDMLKSKLPSLLMAVILLLVLSASMSTLSSLVLISSSSVAIDMYKGHINPRISKKNSLTMMRFLSGLFVLISFLIARLRPTFIVYLMSISWGLVAGSFMAPYLYGLFWKRTTKTGAAAGMATGFVLCIVLILIWGLGKSPIAATIAMIAPFVVIPIVSVFTRPPDREVIDKAFDGV
jgi:SSS family solute:Na+ symporter